MTETEASVAASWQSTHALEQKVHEVFKSMYSQVGDPSFTHSAWDCFDRRAKRVQQRCQLSGSLRFPSLLYNEAGDGDHVGIKCCSVGHDGGLVSLQPESRRMEETLQDLNALQRGTRWRRECKHKGQSRAAGEVWPRWKQEPLCTHWPGEWWNDTCTNTGMWAE